jgi:hypothetical protein
MPTVDAEGLTRIQAQSRIPVTQWKEWCDVLGLRIGDVAEIWDVVCFPMMAASRSIPDVAYILQMRAARSDIDLEEFKEELAPILHTNALLGSLQDESIAGGRYRAAVLQLYRHVSNLPVSSISSRDCVRHTIVELCTTVLLTKVLPGENVSFTRLVRVLTEGRTSRQALCSMVAQAEPIAEVVDFLQALDDFDSAAQAQPGNTHTTGVDEESASPTDDDDGAEAEHSTEVVEESELDDVEDEGDEEDEIDLFLDHFRLALSAIYDPEALGDEGTAESPEARERAIVEFDPLTARIPSVEEARQLASGGGGGGNASRARQRGPSKSANPLLGKPSGVREYLFGAVWPFAHPIHESTDVIRQLEQLVRKDLSAFARFEPRRERHHRNPHVALSVVGLDRLTGNPELASLFVRVNVESKLLVIEDFEDGSYVDLFELRQNERRQMHARAKERAATEDSGELQVGTNYLYSLGRTNKPFGGNLAEVMGGCVLTEEGEPMVYPIF